VAKSNFRIQKLPFRAWPVDRNSKAGIDPRENVTGGHVCAPLAVALEVERPRIMTAGIEAQLSNLFQ
jgi:hypothetical protein